MKNLPQPFQNQVKILIVDDTPESLFLLQRMLKKHGYKTELAYNGTSALEKAFANPPDLILLDVMMPDLSGYEVCKQLKADARTRAVPVIFISALNKVFEIVKAFSFGAVDYITKPFQIEEVVVRVKTHLMVRMLQDTLQQKVNALQTLTDSLQEEMVLAHNIQKSLLPPPQPNWPHLDVVCYSKSARQVGGDWYDYHAFDLPINFALPQTEALGQQIGSYGIAVGDVSGKGMPAALLMGVSLSWFQSALRQEFGPAELLEHLDEALVPYTQTTNLNCALVYIELSSNLPLSEGKFTLRLSNAGCVTPLLRRGDEVQWIEIGGTPLGTGLGAELGYEEQTMELQPSDIIVLTSDGVIEAGNQIGQMLGFENLREMVATGPTDSAQTMLNHLCELIDAFVGTTEPHDDITIVVVRV